MLRSTLTVLLPEKVKVAVMTRRKVGVAILGQPAPKAFIFRVVRRDLLVELPAKVVQADVLVQIQEIRKVLREIGQPEELSMIVSVFRGRAHELIPGVDAAALTETRLYHSWSPTP